MAVKVQLVLSIVFVCYLGVNGQFYEDKRCRCICPSPSVVLNNTLSNSRKLFIANVPPNKCNCDEVIVMRVSEEVRARLQEYCPRCECKYETRNTTVILVVVVMVLWVLMLLSVYMGFLLCLDPLIKRKRAKTYREAGDGEEACTLLIPGEDED
ncbi:hypothetical protein ABMA27_000078 [Loxostege sticticalis]|uniref:Transmembrane protein 9 n=1 Tax=Loxostege sticticalis TaxID=481309 RepID=A0ABR3IM19_LOXSC